MNPAKMKKEQLVAEVIRLRDSVSEQSGIIDDLKQQAKEANALSDEKSSAIDSLKDKVGEMDQALASKDEKIKELEGSLEAALDREKALTEEVQNLRKQVVNVRNDAQGIQNRIGELIVSNSRLKVWKYVAVSAIVAFLISLCFIVA